MSLSVVSPAAMCLANDLFALDSSCNKIVMCSCLVFMVIGFIKPGDYPGQMLEIVFVDGMEIRISFAICRPEVLIISIPLDDVVNSRCDGFHFILHCL